MTISKKEYLYCGTAVKTDEGKYRIWNKRQDIDLSEKLYLLWQPETQIHIIMSNDKKSLLDQEGTLQLERPNGDKSKPYTYHINGINIEQFIESCLDNLISININICNTDTSITEENAEISEDTKNATAK